MFKYLKNIRHFGVINLNLSRRGFLSAIGGGALALLDACSPTISVRNNSSNTSNIDDLVDYEGQYIHSRKLREENALLIALNLLSPNSHTRYNRAESNGEVIKMISHPNWAILFPPLQHEAASYLIPNFPKFLSLVGYKSSDELIWPKEFGVKDSKKIKEIFEYMNAETRIPLKPGTTYDQHLSEIIKRSEYLGLLKQASDKHNVLAEGILEQELRIMLEAANYDTKHQTDAESQNKYYGLNRWRDFNIVSFGVQVVPEFKIGVPINRDLSNGYIKIEFDLYAPSQRDSDRRDAKIEIALDDFRKMTEGTKYNIDDYRNASEELQADFNSGKLNGHLLKFMNRLYVYGVNRALSSPIPQLQGIDFAQSRLEDFRLRAAATPPDSDMGIKSAVVAYHEHYKT